MAAKGWNSCCGIRPSAGRSSLTLTRVRAPCGRTVTSIALLACSTALLTSSPVSSSASSHHSPASWPRSVRTNLLASPTLSGRGANRRERGTFGAMSDMPPSFRHAGRRTPQAPPTGDGQAVTVRTKASRLSRIRAILPSSPRLSSKPRPAALSFMPRR